MTAVQAKVLVHNSGSQLSILIRQQCRPKSWLTGYKNCFYFPWIKLKKKKHCTCISLSGPESASVSLGISEARSWKTKQLSRAQHWAGLRSLNTLLNRSSVITSSSPLYKHTAVSVLHLWSGVVIPLLQTPMTGRFFLVGGGGGGEDGGGVKPVRPSVLLLSW